MKSGRGEVVLLDQSLRRRIKLRRIRRSFEESTVELCSTHRLDVRPCNKGLLEGLPGMWVRFFAHDVVRERNEPISEKIPDRVRVSRVSIEHYADLFFVRLFFKRLRDGKVEEKAVLLGHTASIDILRYITVPKK